MIVVKTLDEFVKLNDVELERIVISLFPKKSWKIFELEDVKQDIYLRFKSQGTVEKWSPDLGAAFSTYIYKCVKNHIHSYYLKYGSREKVQLASESIYDPVKEDGSPLIEMIIPEDGDFVEYRDSVINFRYVHKILSEYDEVCHRRHLSFSNLLASILEGNSDSEIASLFSMTVANVCSQKKTLADLIRKCENGSILSTIKINRNTNYGRKNRQRKTSKHLRYVDSRCSEQSL